MREKPKPYGGTRPIVMNAGITPTGRAYAMRHSDLYFTGRYFAVSDLQPMIDEVASVNAAAREVGREVDVCTSVFVTCRPTRAEAEAYVHYAIDENADWDALEKLHAGRKHMAGPGVDVDKMRAEMPRFVLGKALIGDPDDVAHGLAQYTAAGLRGLGLTFVNFGAELPYFCDEVLPRLERLGVRVSPSKGRTMHRPPRLNVGARLFADPYPRAEWGPRDEPVLARRGVHLVIGRRENCTLRTRDRFARGAEGLEMLHCGDQLRLIRRVGELGGQGR